ncbi:hypothetical protein [Streptacidiphilus sp. MAP5-52]|uniref:hypothetical protein n=1 Tax=Streptacidiphilus sp. MAP5-52 TaxID=3156267 RepID=UPI0035159F8A
MRATALHEDSQISALLALLAALLTFAGLLTSYRPSTALLGAALVYVLVLRSATRRLQVQPTAALLATVLITGALFTGVLAFGWRRAKRGQR